MLCIVVSKRRERRWARGDGMVEGHGNVCGTTLVTGCTDVNEMDWQKQ